MIKFIYVSGFSFIMAVIDNKVDDVMVFGASGDAGLHVTLRRSYLPLGGLVAVTNCVCENSAKEKLFYLKGHHFIQEDKTIVCDCGRKVTFSYEKSFD
jgi:hypothetical protein